MDMMDIERQTCQEGYHQLSPHADVPQGRWAAQTGRCSGLILMNTTLCVCIFCGVLGSVCLSIYYTRLRCLSAGVLYEYRFVYCLPGYEADFSAYCTV